MTMEVPVLRELLQLSSQLLSVPVLAQLLIECNVTRQEVVMPSARAEAWEVVAEESLL